MNNLIEIRGRFYTPKNDIERKMMEGTKDWTDDTFTRFFEEAIGHMPVTSMSDDETLKEFKKIYHWWK